MEIRKHISAHKLATSCVSVGRSASCPQNHPKLKNDETTPPDEIFISTDTCFKITYLAVLELATSGPVNPKSTPPDLFFICENLCKSVA